jgi:hypothetical protein
MFGVHGPERSTLAVMTRIIATVPTSDMLCLFKLVRSCGSARQCALNVLLPLNFLKLRRRNLAVPGPSFH